MTEEEWIKARAIDITPKDDDAVTPALPEGNDKS
jgi:hypothetical protein